MKHCLSAAVLHSPQDGERRIVTQEGSGNGISIIVPTADEGPKAFEFDKVEDLKTTGNSSTANELSALLAQEASNGHSATLFSIGNEGNLEWLAGNNFGLLRRLTKRLIETIGKHHQQANARPKQPLLLSAFEIYEDGAIDLMTRKKIPLLEPIGEIEPKLPGLLPIEISTLEDFDSAISLAVSNAHPTKNTFTIKTHIFFRFSIKMLSNNQNVSSKTATLTILPPSTTSNSAILTTSALEAPLLSRIAGRTTTTAATQVIPKRNKHNSKTTNLDVVCLASINASNSRDFLTQDQQAVRRSLMTLGHLIDRINGKASSVGITWKSSKLSQLLRVNLTTPSLTIIVAHSSGTSKSISDTLWSYTFAASIRAIGNEMKLSELEIPPSNYPQNQQQNENETKRRMSKTDVQRQIQQQRTEMMTVHTQTVKALRESLNDERKDKEEIESSLGHQLRNEREKSTKTKERMEFLERQLELRNQEIEQMKLEVETMKEMFKKQLYDLQNVTTQRMEKHRKDLERQESIIDKQNISLASLQRQLASSSSYSSPSSKGILSEEDLLEIERLVVEQRNELTTIDQRISEFQNEQQKQPRLTQEQIHQMLMEEILKLSQQPITSSKTPNIVRSLEIADSIVDDFIKVDSRMALNISGPTRDVIITTLKSSTSSSSLPPSDMFDSAKKEVLKILRMNNSLMKFKTSTQCLNALKLAEESGYPISSSESVLDSIESVFQNKALWKAFCEFLKNELHCDECSEFIEQVEIFKQSLIQTAEKESKEANIREIASKLHEIFSNDSKPKSTTNDSETNATEAEHSLELIRTESRVCLTHVLAMLRAGWMQISGIEELCLSIERQLNDGHNSGASTAYAESMAAIRRVRAVVDLLKESSIATKNAFPSDGEEDIQVESGGNEDGEEIEDLTIDDLDEDDEQKP